MENTKYIYIVLIKALTGIGKISRKITKYEYTHIAISFDEELKDFITFSRRKHYAPFNAGFMHEKREYYAFGKNKEIKVKIFKLPVSQENMLKIKNYIQKIKNDKEYIFNLYSMITMPIFHGVKIYKAYNCMSFVGKVIEFSGSVTLKKKYYKYNIQEMDNLLEKYFIKECYLEKTKDDDDYMEKINIFSNIKSFLKLNAQLIYRMIFKRKEDYE